MTTEIEFKPWPKTPRLFRDMTITEKIDGTNAAVIITEGGQVGAQSRNRLITPGKTSDNCGFAAWVAKYAAGLRELLGPGHHYGEWWGKGIQRGYGAELTKFSLFNVKRYAAVPQQNYQLDHGLYVPGLRLVPTLYVGPFSTEAIRAAIESLRTYGSTAAPGFAPAEGVVVHLSASGQVYKVLLENDDRPKGEAA